jgi:gamma-glutamyltranspeptidase / glutathione hydrolase
MKALRILSLSLLLAACSTADKDIPAEVSAASAGAAWGHGAMVAAANPHAVSAAMEMLEQGGHAVDAAIAAHAVLGLVEPQSSGIGGGGFMLVYERAADSLVFHDGREQAPAGATVDMFMRDGEVMNFYEAWQSGLAVGAPGAIALYETAHKEHGNLDWAELFQPAIRLAEQGFIVSPRLANFLPRLTKVSLLDDNPQSAAYFYPNGEALKAGDLRKNPDYAETLRRVAQEGSSAFYQGEIAQEIVSAVQMQPNPGLLTTEDLANYRTVRRDAICGNFREDKICTTTPPSSGGAQIMIAGLYDHLSADAENQADKVAAFIDAQRLAYADRDHFFGDPDAIDIPLQDLLDPAYLQHRAGQRVAPAATPQHGDPAAFFNRQAALNEWAADTTEEVPGTTHLSIIDGEGNAVAMTATVEAPFGSSRLVGGFLLNNQMTDFAREVPKDGRPVANAIAPGRRPRSSMSPTMVFDAEGELRMITGSPGGNSIPAYVAKSIVGVLDWNLSAQQAVDLPNLVARGEKVRVEVVDGVGQDIADDLKKRGYNVQEREGENSGLHVIVVNPDGLDGAADKRREGTVDRIPAGA